MKIDKKNSELVERKYRPLKQLLKKTVKIIGDALAGGQFPSALVMSDFMAQVKVLVSYPGFGDEYYPPFLAACVSLAAAFKEKDLPLFSECFATVLDLKKECHHRYK